MHEGAAPSDAPSVQIAEATVLVDLLLDTQIVKSKGDRAPPD